MDPLVIIKLGEKQEKVEFLVDTGATYSVLNQALMPLEKDYITVKGATGQTEEAYFCRPLKYKLGKQVGDPYISVYAKFSKGPSW